MFRIVGLCGLSIALGALEPAWSAEKDKEQKEAKGPLDKDGKNSISMEFKLIPKGTFTMGSPETDKDRSDDEKEHEVKIERAFYLGKYECTQKQYKTIMGKNPSYFQLGGKGKDKLKDKNGKAVENTDDFPVEMVSYEDAVMFIDNLNEKEKKTLGKWKYSLPTEAQWEYACRGGATSYKKYHFGNAISEDDANFKGPVGCTTKVGSYPANKFGLHDMHGNVWEWCLDWYDKNYKGADKDFKGAKRVDRGGNWASTARYCRSANRDGDDPELRNNGLGFRVALVATK
jgi:formylglycine-generating enzyme required for sulfatase activity